MVERCIFSEYLFFAKAMLLLKKKKKFDNSDDGTGKSNNVKRGRPRKINSVE